jgi:GT2 family glycosyltransferase
VLAVVVSYNNAVDLPECVASLVDSGVDEIVVYDNASPDPAVREVLDAISEHAPTKSRPRVTVEFGSENLGFGPALNLVTASRDRFDFFWFVNPDVIASPRSASRLVETMVAQDVAIASPVVTTGESGETVWFAGGHLHRALGLSEHVVELAPAEDGLVLATFITGAAMMVRAEAWFALGGFREDLFLYWEDAELSARAIDAGFRLGVVTGVSVWHRVGASGSKSGMSREFHYYMNRNRLIVCGRYAPRWSLLVGGGWRVTARMLRAATRERERPLKKTRAGIRGALEGLMYRSTSPA